MTAAQALMISQGYGRGVAALRRLAGWNQKQLGMQLGMAQSTVSEIESGQRNLTAVDIEHMLQVFAGAIPGYDEEDCWRVMRPASRPTLSLVPPVDEAVREHGGALTTDSENGSDSDRPFKLRDVA